MKPATDRLSRVTFYVFIVLLVILLQAFIQVDRTICFDLTNKNVTLTDICTIRDRVNCYNTTFQVTKEEQLYCSDKIYSIFKDEDVKSSGTSSHHPFANENHNSAYLTFQNCEYLLLIAQTIGFYLVLKVWECRDMRLKRLVERLPDASNSELNKEDFKTYQDNVLVLIFRRSRVHYRWFLFSELFSSLNLIGQFIILDRYLHRQFSKNMLKFLKYLVGLDRTYEFVELFSNVYPRSGQCSIHYLDDDFYDKQKIFECVLGINELKQKIFITIWGAFVVLSYGHLLVLLHRVLLFVMPKYRYLKLDRKLKHRNADFIKIATERMRHWFILNYLASNVEPDLIDHIEGGNFLKYLNNFEI